MAVYGDEAARAEIMALYERFIRRRQVTAPSPSNRYSSSDNDNEEWNGDDSERTYANDDESCSIEIETDEGSESEDAKVAYHRQWVIRKAGFMPGLQDMAEDGDIEPDLLETIQYHLCPWDDAEEKKVEENEGGSTRLVYEKTQAGLFDEDQEYQLLVFLALGPIEKPKGWDSEEVEAPAEEVTAIEHNVKGIKATGKEPKVISNDAKEPVELQAIPSLEVNKHGQPVKPMRKRRVNPA